MCYLRTTQVVGAKSLLSGARETDAGSQFVRRACFAAAGSAERAVSFRSLGSPTHKRRPTVIGRRPPMRAGRGPIRAFIIIVLTDVSVCVCVFVFVETWPRPTRFSVFRPFPRGPRRLPVPTLPYPLCSPHTHTHSAAHGFLAAAAAEPRGFAPAKRPADRKCRAPGPPPEPSGRAAEKRLKPRRETPPPPSPPPPLYTGRGHPDAKRFVDDRMNVRRFSVSAVTRKGLLPPTAPNESRTRNGFVARTD